MKIVGPSQRTHCRISQLLGIIGFCFLDDISALSVILSYLKSLRLYQDFKVRRAHKRAKTPSFLFFKSLTHYSCYSFFPSNVIDCPDISACGGGCF